MIGRLQMLDAGRKVVTAVTLGAAIALAGTGSALSITLVDTSSGTNVFNPRAVPSRINYARVFQSFDFVTDAIVTNLTWYGSRTFSGYIGLYDDYGKEIYSRKPDNISVGGNSQWLFGYKASELNWRVQKSRRYWLSVFANYETGYWEWTTSNASEAIAYTLTHSPSVDASDSRDFRQRGEILTVDGAPIGVAFKIEGIEQVTAIPVPPALSTILTAFLGLFAFAVFNRHGAARATPSMPVT